MKILAIETATEACSAALLINNDVIHRFKVAPREHGDLILPMVDELLVEAGIQLTQLDALAFGRGPGSFTGVRMATGVVQGLAFAADLPVAPISTLEALANQVALKAGVKHIFAAMDARMGEVYCCEFKNSNGVIVQASEERVIAPQMLTALTVTETIGIGHGWQTYPEEIKKALGCDVTAMYPEALPSAVEVAKLAIDCVKQGKTVSAEHAMPVYLRDNVAKKKAQ